MALLRMMSLPCSSAAVSCSVPGFDRHINVSIAAAAAGANNDSCRPSMACEYFCSSSIRQDDHEAELSAPSSTHHHPCSRRRFWVLSASALVASSALSQLPAHARDRRNKKVIPLEDYQTTSDGLMYYDLLEGKGPVAHKGETVLVHFDCIYRGIDAVSSRESKILGGNRIIAQPYEFIVGSIPGKERKRDFVDNANGLFSAQAAPKPPPALYSVTEGMHVGGKRTIIVPPELGYGNKGSNEIPPDATFQMDVELLEVKKGPSN